MMDIALKQHLHASRLVQQGVDDRVNRINKEREAKITRAIESVNQLKEPVLV